MAELKDTVYFADMASFAGIASLTASKYGTGGEAVISTQTDNNGRDYVHISTGGATVVTTITGENVTVGKIMFIKYRLNNGYYPEGSFAVKVRYKKDGEEKLAVGSSPAGAVLNVDLVKRHRGWVVGRVNAQGQLGKVGLWTDDASRVEAEKIIIEIIHSDDLDIAYFMTDNYDANLMPTVEEYRDDYYMHQNIEFGCYIDNQWRKINDTMNGGIKQNDPFTPPHLPEHADEPDPVFYSVSFVLCGYGADIDPQSIRSGKKVVKPTNPTTEAYKFGGWYMSNQYDSKYDFESPVSCDLVLYAEWVEREISKKLRIMAENGPRIYDAGYLEGHDAGHEDGYNKGHSEGYAEGYNDGFADCEASVDNYVPCATSITFRNLNLLGKKEVVLDMPDISDYNGTFRQDILNTTVEHLTVNAPLDGKITTASMTFYSGNHETTLKRLTLNCDFSKCTTFSYMMTYLAALEVIDGIPIDFSSATSINDWHGCAFGSSLRELRVAPNTIKSNISFSTDKLLSYETIQSIIGGLENTVSGKTLTLHKTAVNNAFTDEEWATLIATKPNWTISLA